MSRLAILILFLVAPAITLVGCDAHVDDSYQGETIVTLRGALTSARTSPLADPEVSVVWAQRSMMGRLVGAEKVAAEGLFPQFSLSITSPPPDDMLDVIDGESYGVALVAVASAGTDYSRYTGWRGVDLDQVVVYLPEATRPGATLEAFLHGPTTAGFHIFNVKHLTEQERQARLACVNAIPRNGGMLSTFEIYSQCGGAGNDELTVAPDDLDTLLELEIVEDASVVDLINALPRW